MPRTAKKTPRSKRLPRHYDAIDTGEGEHPIDLIVQREIDDREARRRALALQNRVLAGLGPEERRTFLELEELRNELAAEREEQYFDIGYERGHADARRHEQRRVRPLPKAAVELAADIRDRVLGTRPCHHALLGLIESLHELGLMLVAKPSSPRD